MTGDTNVSPSTAYPAQRLHAVLLWDLDNMPGPQGYRLELAQELSLSVDEQSPRVVAARKGTYRHTQRRLAEAGMEILSGGKSTSGADRRLCERARTLGREGHRAFVVASNDRHFSCLTRLGEVHIITLDLAHLSTRLAAVATTVTVLEFDGSRWVKRPAEADFDEGAISGHDLRGA